MSRKYKFHDQERPYFLSFATVYWLDVFVRPEYKQIIVDSLQYCQDNKDLKLYAWVLMPSHMHLIMGTKGKPMQDILRDFKSRTAEKIMEAIEKHPRESRREWLLWMMERAGKKTGKSKRQFWQHHNKPIELSSNEMIDQRLDYLHMNPVVSGFVSEPWHWRHSSALDYCTDQKGLLDIEFLV